jgi:hypothetical protein
MLRMADNSDGDSDNQGDFGDDGDLMDKIRQLEKEKDKLSRKNTATRSLNHRYFIFTIIIYTGQLFNINLQFLESLSSSDSESFPLSSPLLNELVSVDLFPVKFFSLDLCSFNIVKGHYPLLLKMMRSCIFPLHCCTLYFRKDCSHVQF